LYLTQSGGEVRAHLIQHCWCHQADYALDNDEDVYLINKCAAELAKKSTADYMAKHPGEVKFVAGAIGPTNKTLSVSPSVENPAFRGITYDEVEEAYYKQVRCMRDGLAAQVVICC
jgi:5-methyltetrahydrofolate--homocysteine methyltransferase